MAKNFGPGGVEFSKRNFGLLSQGYEQGIYEASTTQKAPIGAVIEFDNGDKYRYAHFVAAANRGTVVAQDISVSCSGVIDGKATAAAAGATKVTLTDTDTFGTADVADVYAGGWLQVEDDAGEGHIYRIQSNPVGTSAGVMVLTLMDAIEVALTTDTDVAIIGSMYRQLRPATTTDPFVVGVAMMTMAAAEYGWIKTAGVASCLADLVASGLMTIGAPVFLSDGTAGAVQNFAGVASNTTLNSGDWDTPLVGYAMHAATNAAHVAVRLQLGD